jgi:hypothetical protein
MGRSDLWKRMSIFVLLICFVLLGGKFVFSASEEPIFVTAEIPTNSPQIKLVILKFTDGNPDNDPWTESTQEGFLDFGTLTYLLADSSNAGLFYSPNGYCVVIFADSFGRPYDITSSCLGITDGVNFLPAGSFGLVPVYSEKDKYVYPGGESVQGSIPDGASLGPAGTAVNPNALIYSSELGIAKARIIQAYYSLPPKKAGGADPFPGFEPIPLTQTPGVYTGVVKITIVLK